jgi:hypothetical protein
MAGLFLKIFGDYASISDLSCHIGNNGDIIIPLEDEDHLRLSPLEAQDFYRKLDQVIKDYKAALNA